MKIIICGSMQYESVMARIAKELMGRGYEVEQPNTTEGRAYEKDGNANAALKRGFINEHFAKIDTSEAILVVNEPKSGIDGYIGGNTLIEIAYAYSQGLDVFLLHQVPDLSYADEIRAMHPIVLGGDLGKIDEYIAALPLVYVSTESRLKHRAVSRAMRRAGISVRVAGQKVSSGVPEQPMSIEETYDGAMNRHALLSEQGVDADYYITVESGQYYPHSNHSSFGCTVVVVEPRGQDARAGIDVDIEFPREWVSKVPSQYQDLGVLVQQEYGMAEKDPTSVITGGKLTRAQVIENAAYNVIVQVQKGGK